MCAWHGPKPGDFLRVAEAALIIQQIAGTCEGFEVDAHRPVRGDGDEGEGFRVGEVEMEVFEWCCELWFAVWRDRDGNLARRDFKPCAENVAQGASVMRPTDRVGGGTEFRGAGVFFLGKGRIIHTGGDRTARAGRDDVDGDGAGFHSPIGVPNPSTERFRRVSRMQSAEATRRDMETFG